ncbi:MAG: hypothetical protein N2440_01845 [Actinobacteria bacterium]|nr:hypothetical protein [Actinomycetota bacterium]
MDRLERKTNIFYLEYLPEIKELLNAIKERGVDVSEAERLIENLEEAIKKKDYLLADQLIVMLQEEVERAKLEAGIFDNTGFFF